MILIKLFERGKNFEDLASLSNVVDTQVKKCLFSVCFLYRTDVRTSVIKTLEFMKLIATFIHYHGFPLLSVFQGTQERYLL